MQRLIVGLGNPGPEYAHTRHNLGCMVVAHLAEKEGVQFRFDRDLHAKVARAETLSCLLLLPMTYMNRSGIAVRAGLKHFGITPQQCLVVCDDLDLPFGATRIRTEGSSGGHNGLKSIEFYLGTAAYCRLRLGIGRPPEGHDVAEYVLEKFSKDECALLPEFIDKAVAQISSW